jgi:hypothetical protein
VCEDSKPTVRKIYFVAFLASNAHWTARHHVKILNVTISLRYLASKAADMLSKPIERRASIGFRIAPFQGLDIEDTYEVEKLKQALLADPWNLTPVPDHELAPSSPPATVIRQFLYAVPLVIAAIFLMGGGTGIGAVARGVMWSSVPALLGLSLAIWSVYSSSIVTLWFETGRPIPIEAPFKPPRLTRDNSLIALRT